MTQETDQLKLKRGRRHRVLKGHPWVFGNEVEPLLPAEFDGKAVTLVNAKGHFLGRGIYNSRSQIAWRRFSGVKDAEFDRGFLETALRDALERREDGSMQRLVWSEADDIPGLVVDQFDDVLVVQALTLAVERQLETISEILDSLLKPKEIVYRNDAPTRKHEGLDLEVRSRSGKDFEPRWFNIDGLDYRLDLQKGHKTGFYLDQRQQHLEVAALAKGRRVLDGFCHVGAFALQCAKAGATEVVGVDISEECIDAAQRNAEKNQLEVNFSCANMFDFFGEHGKETYDLIVLDPPSFARNRGALEGALRGYKELNLRALKMLQPGGILATYSCSQHVSRQIFMDMLADAAGDAGRTVEVISLTGQPPDHPVRLNFPESEYLKGAILEVRS